MQRSRFYLSLAACLLLIGCNKPEDNPNPNKPTPDNNNQKQTCGPSGTICVGANICCGDSCVDTSLSLSNCGACGVKCDTEKGEVCINGKCKANSVDEVICNQGNTRCEENEYQACNNNSWNKVETCTPDQDCIEGQGCMDRANQCNEATYKCIDGDLNVCANGKYKVAMECGEGTTCNEEKATCTIDVQVICTAKDKKCEDNKIKVCADDGSAWNVAVPCSNKQMCDSNGNTPACVEINCTNNDKECRDGDVFICQNNDFQLADDCNDNQFCKDAKCIDIVCQEGEKKCEANTVKLCKDNKWESIIPCTTGTYCDENSFTCKSNCGNGTIDPGEACDTNNLNGATCASATGHQDATGNLTCNGDCSGFVQKDCVYCGDNKVNGQEICDGTKGDAPTCDVATKNKYSQGVVVCQDNCKGWNIDQCSNPECGAGEEIRCHGSITPNQGQTIQLCVDGKWENYDNCPIENPICDLTYEADLGEHDYCVASSGVCSGEDIMCSGNLLVCDNNRWITYDICGAEKPYCDSEKQSCFASAPTCDKVGEYKCDGNIIMKCALNNNKQEWVVEKKCTGSGNEYCAKTGDNNFACVFSTEKCTTVGESKCYGNNILLCGEDKFWYYSYPCSGTTKYCNAKRGECVAYNQCKEDEVRCNKGKFEMCDIDQSWVELNNCTENNQQCDLNAESGCSGSLGDCNSGAHKCSGKTFMVCGTDLKWKEQETCSGINSVCDDTVGCTGRCSNGDKRCHENSYYECDNGKWVELANCSTNTDGYNVCDSTSTNGCVTGKTCSATFRCENNSHIECKDGLDIKTMYCYIGDKDAGECNATEGCVAPSTTVSWGTFKMDNFSNTNGHAYLEVNPNGKAPTDYEVRLVCGKAKDAVIEWDITAPMVQNTGFNPNGGNNIEYWGELPKISKDVIDAGLYCTAEIRNVGTNNWFYFPPNMYDKSSPALLVTHYLYRNNVPDHFWGAIY